MTLYVANASAGDASTWEQQRTDLWELQQDVADYISGELAQHYTDIGDWTGRKKTSADLMDLAFRMGEGVDTIGLPNGVTITIKEEDDG